MTFVGPQMSAYTALICGKRLTNAYSIELLGISYTRL